MTSPSSEMSTPEPSPRSAARRGMPSARTTARDEVVMVTTDPLTRSKASARSWARAGPLAQPPRTGPIRAASIESRMGSSPP